MSEGEIVTPVPDLRALAERINRAHERCLGHARMTVEAAVEAGTLLIEAKRLCGHGGFLEWVEANCGVTARQAQRYMKVARGALDGKYDATSHLTITEAISSVVTRDDFTRRALGPLSPGQRVRVRELESRIEAGLREGRSAILDLDARREELLKGHPDDPAYQTLGRFLRKLPGWTIAYPHLSVEEVIEMLEAIITDPHLSVEGAIERAEASVFAEDES